MGGLGGGVRRELGWWGWGGIENIIYVIHFYKYNYDIVNNLTVGCLKLPKIIVNTSKNIKIK